MFDIIKLVREEGRDLVTVLYFLDGYLHFYLYS